MTWHPSGVRRCLRLAAIGCFVVGVFIPSSAFIFVGLALVAASLP